MASYKNGMMPFLFYIPAHGLHSTVEKDTWVVKVALFDYSPYKSAWMADDLLGECCLTPTVDLTKEQHVFDNEEAALEFIKNWWASQV